MNSRVIVRERRTLHLVIGLLLISAKYAECSYFYCTTMVVSGGEMPEPFVNMSYQMARTLAQ